MTSCHDDDDDDVVVQRRRPPLPLLLLAAATLVCLSAEPCTAGSCAAARLCCQGRDSGCVIQKASPNAIIESPRDKPCYCDHACLRLGDCCDDFNATCGVSDCSVGGWSQWSECDNKCGQGRRTRSRAVARPARNGGKACPETEESAGCQSYESCRRRSRHFQVQEMSFASPGEGGNLDSNLAAAQLSRGYCATFVMLKISRGCRRRLESIHGGSRVCVWCGVAEQEETSERRGHLWSASSSPCHSAGQQQHHHHHRSRGLTPSLMGKWEMPTTSRRRNGQSKDVEEEEGHCHGRWTTADTYGATHWSNCSGPVCLGRPLLMAV